MSDVQISYEEIKASATRLDREREDITAKLQELDRMIQGLVQGAFKTQTSSEKFRDSFGQWHSGAKNVIEGLQGMTTFLNKVVSTHQDVDSNLSSGLGQ